MDLSKFGKDFANKKSMNLTGLAITSEQLKAKKEQKEASTIFDIELTHIKADPNQPRKDFDEEQILELSQDIELHGLIQPIVVRKAGDEDYFIVAGERRFRAYQLLGKTTIRAIIADKNWQENDIGYIQVSENLKRADLKFYELADFIISRIEKGEKQTEIADKLGIQRSEITRYLVWQDVPEDIKNQKEKFGSIRPFSDFMKVYKEHPQESLEYLSTVEKALSRTDIERFKKSLEEPAQDNESLPSSDNEFTSFDESISTSEESFTQDNANTEDSPFEDFDNSNSSQQSYNNAPEQSESIEDNFESSIDDDAQSESTSKESFEIPEDTQVAEYFKFPVIEGWIDDNTPVTLLYKRKPSAEGYVICLDREGNEIEVEAVQFIFGRIVEAK